MRGDPIPYEAPRTGTEPTSEEGETAPERGGRPKRCSRITEAGLDALRRVREEWLAMSRGLEEKLEEAGS